MLVLRRVAYTFKGRLHGRECARARTYTRVPRSHTLRLSHSLSRRTFFPPRAEFDKFICLCGAIGPHLCVVVVGKSTKRKRATKGPPMTVSFQRKRNCGGPAAESSTRCIYRSKIGIKKGVGDERGAVSSNRSDETETVGDEKYRFLFWQVVLPARPFVAQLGHREQILHVADDIEYLNRIDISREREKGRKSARQRRVKNMKFFRRATEPMWKIECGRSVCSRISLGIILRRCKWNVVPVTLTDFR